MLSRFFTVAAVALLGALALPNSAMAVFADTFSFTTTGDVDPIAPGLQVLPSGSGSVSLFFATDSTPAAGGFGCTTLGCVLGYQVNFDSVGTVTADLTAANTSITLGNTNCSTLSGPGGGLSGTDTCGFASTLQENGPALLIATFSFLGLTAGDKLDLVIANFSNGNFATVAATGLPLNLATVIIPEPTTAVLLGAGLAGLAGLRRRREA